MKYIFSFALFLLAACTAPPAIQNSAQMSDEALCFALAEGQPPPGVKAEMQKRDLRCGDLVKTDQNLAPGHPNWRENVEVIDR